MDVHVPLRPSVAIFERAAVERRQRRKEPLTLVLSGFPRPGPGSLVRLVGLLAGVRLAQARISVRLDFDFASSTAEEFFSATPLGFVLLSLSHSISHRKQELRRILWGAAHRHLEISQGVIARGNAALFPIVDDIGSTRAATVVATNEPHIFVGEIHKCMAATFGLSAAPAKALAPMSELLFELLQNTRDHATTALDGTAIRGIRLLELRRWDAATAVAKDFHPEGRTRSDFLVEASIADCGVGIPARMARSAAVYAEPTPDNELEFLNRAFERGGTSKPSQTAGVGLGLHKVARAADELGARIGLRTGRVSATLENVRGQVLAMPTESSARAFVGGTCVSVWAPWFDPRQRRLGL